jgi:DNA-binding response OmpR family regulator
MPESILIVDDDHQITEFLERFLSKHGFKTASAGSATQMGLLMEHRAFELIILDVGLPDADGFQVVRDLRQGSSIPIVLLTVRDEVYDKIIGLEMGADDYIAKPFEPRELLARIRSVLRRTSGKLDAPVVSPNGETVFSGFMLNIETRVLTSPDNDPVALTSTEYTLLAALLHRTGEVVRRDQLMDLLYSGSVHVTERAIDAHIARLRRKLENSGGRADLIKTAHGAGYVLAAKIETADP